MAAVFLFSQATLWLRTGVMPRWMPCLTFAIALLLLFVISWSPWIVLVFPGWVFLVSLSILVLILHARRPDRADGMTADAAAAPR